MRSGTRKNRDAAFLRFIKTQDCSVPGCQAIYIEAHHAGDHGFSQKAPDRTAIPLCANHHQHGPLAVHVLEKLFYSHHRIDRDEIIERLNLRYDSERLGVLDPLDVIGISA